MTDIPAGMTPWHGGDRAPDDWDGGRVWLGDERQMWAGSDENLFSTFVDWRASALGLMPVRAYTRTAPAVAPDEGVTQADRDDGLAVYRDYLNGKLDDAGGEYEGEECAIHAFARARGHLPAAPSAPISERERGLVEAIALDAESEASACRHAQNNAESAGDKLYRMGQKDALLLFASRVRDGTILASFDQGRG